MKKDELKNRIHTIPNKPGVYQFFNEKEEIIYIGKAKDLKKRVSSYFTNKNHANKTRVLVKNIANVKYIVVETESDALLLENNLIKEYQPRYNVLLKDDKSYPSICISNEPFPRIFKTRKIIDDGSKYFGPYTSVWAVESMLELIHQLYPIRTCKLNLSKANIDLKKYTVCLQYHIHKCNASCVGMETEEEYQKYIDGAEKIIRGDVNELSKALLDEIKVLAQAMRFEEANQLKQKYEVLENYKAKSIITNTVLEETEVFSYDEDEHSSYINMLRITKGSISLGYTVSYRKRMDESKEDILATAILDLREKFKSKAKEIILAFELEYSIPGVNITVPKRGDKKKLLDLSAQNVKLYKLDQLKRREKLNPEQRSTAILKNLQEKLKLEKLPMQIDAFDNSNISGTDAVGACVVFKKGRPSKKDYRKYTIKSVDGPDDYASMREVVFRRYDRFLKEGTPLPDLILTDGGLGQMHAIKQVLENELGIDIPIVGLVKNKKHITHEILYGFPPQSVGISPNDLLFKFLATIQEEVHRFAISFHRDKRSKTQKQSELDQIPGIGEKSKFELMQHFKSVKRLQKANLDEIAKIIGNNRASKVYLYFHKELKAQE